MSCDRPFIWILSSLDHPVYRQIQDLRRPLLERYGIPYTVVLNAADDGSAPDSTVSSTFVPLQPDEVLYPIGGVQPTMTRKFLDAVRHYFRSLPYDEIPDFLIRMNATVYVYFPQLLCLLQDMHPRTGWLIEPAYGHEFVCGMLMIFSKDVLLRMIRDERVSDRRFMDRPDDVVLSDLSHPYSRWHSLLPHFVYPDATTMTPDGMLRLDVIWPRETQKWYFRIRDLHHADRRMDVYNWKLLLDYFDSNDALDGIRWGSVIFFLILLGIVITLCSIRVISMGRALKKQSPSG